MKPIIGLEIHVQLKTKSKMFCACDAAYSGAEPNTHMCPVCLGLPGALPVPNKQALHNAIKAGIALHCDINEVSQFDRKNYMYPDLFKGYQITQYAFPICGNGYIDIMRKDGSFFRVGIIRAHQEEDTAKSIHEKDWTLIDGNKSGVPLLEIVSEPDMASVEDALLFAQTIQSTMKFIGISDCDMEKGQMRFDVNINLAIEDKESSSDETIATPIVEIKNLNSFHAMSRALLYEIERQQQEYAATGIHFAKGNKTTRGWSDEKGSTYLLRTKEEAEDYRYFPEPDIPPVVFTSEEVQSLRTEVGVLPGTIFLRYVEELGLPRETAELLSFSHPLHIYYESCLTVLHEPNLIANWLKGELLYYANQGGYTFNSVEDIEHLLPVQNFVALLSAQLNGSISGTIAKEVFQEMLHTHKHPEDIIREKGLLQISDEHIIEEAIDTVIAQNISAVMNFKSGKQGALMFIVGQVMKEMHGKGNPGLIRAKVEKKLSNV